MLFVVDPHSGVPIFRQLMEQVKFHIASGLLKPGDELPSIRTLSVPLGVNPMTISKAYNLLVRDGVLERRPGLPLIVKNIAGDQLQACKLDQLQKSLRSSVTVVAQLEIDHDEALTTFRTMLTEELTEELTDESRGPGTLNHPGGTDDENDDENDDQKETLS